MVFGLNFLRERYKGFEVGAKPFFFLEKVGSKLLYRRRVVKEEIREAEPKKDNLLMPYFAETLSFCFACYLFI